MRKGFTIIELLVASLLLGMLMTILTMIFNQSSIAWRTGMAGSMDMKQVRENIAELREESDNVFVHGGKIYRITGLFQENGELRDRACDAPGSIDENTSKATYLGGSGRSGSAWISNLSNLEPKDFNCASVNGNGSSQGAKNYSVNVMSCGPNGTFNDYDDIWSWPDDFD